jgi:hypothetical protein
LHSKLEKELGRIKVQLMNASGEARAFWTARKAVIQELLDGGKPPKAVKPSPALPAKPKPAPISEAQRDAIAAKAAKELAEFRRKERVRA